MQLFITIINMVLLRGECSLNKCPKDGRGGGEDADEVILFGEKVKRGA